MKSSHVERHLYVMLSKQFNGNWNPWNLIDFPFALQFFHLIQWLLSNLYAQYGKKREQSQGISSLKWGIRVVTPFIMSFHCCNMDYLLNWGVVLSMPLHECNPKHLYFRVWLIIVFAHSRRGYLHFEAYRGIDERLCHWQYRIVAWHGVHVK